MSDPFEPLAASQSESAADETLPLAELEPEASADVARSSKSVAIIGGGLAGMAAAVAACEQGLQVELFEQSNRLGGRAGSMVESWNGQTIDQCRHVAMGCCTNFMDFCRRTGVEDCFERHKTLHFIGPDGGQYDFSAVGWLPAPFHLLPGLFGLKYFTRQERWNIIRTLGKMIRMNPFLLDGFETIGVWLRRHGQTEQVIEKFWSVILIAALAETVDFISVDAARKVFVDGFCASRGAYELIMSRLSLGEIFDRRVPAFLAQRGVKIHRGARVAQIMIRGTEGVAVYSDQGSAQRFDAVIAAVPWYEMSDLFSTSPAELPLELYEPKLLDAAGITAVHLWFDRAITALPHAILAGRLSQWIFNETRFSPSGDSHYYQVVISAAHRLIKQGKEELLQAVLNDLQAVFADARQAKLLNWRVVMMPRAVFSMQPITDLYRPFQRTKVENLFFAGDWTSTGWPGTMESAVRSGYMAVEALLESLGRSKKLLAPDLPRGILMRRF